MRFIFNKAQIRMHMDEIEIFSNGQFNQLKYSELLRQNNSPKFIINKFSIIDYLSVL